jgi:hypothetical protein
LILKVGLNAAFNSVNNTQQVEELSPVKITVGLSRRKHLPCLKLGEQIFWPWEFSQYKKIENLKLALTTTGINMTKEMLQYGHYYLPKFSLEEKIVLDIGACCGESADIYLKAGAKKVICIEPDSDRVKHIEFNKKNLGWNVDIIPEKARPEHILDAKPDLIKCDIEGYEMDLINYLPNYPCVLEVHNYWIRDRFEEKGFSDISPPDPMLGECIMANKRFLCP